MSRTIQTRPRKGPYGRMYRVGQAYMIRRGDDCGSVGKITGFEVSHDGLPYNHVMIQLDCGNGININCADEWLEPVEVKDCPCPHGNCAEYVRTK